MSPIAIDKCQAFLDAQFHAAAAGRERSKAVTLRGVTLARQAGCGAREVAERLAELLDLQRAPDDVVSWTVFDQNLMAEVLKDHHLPTRFARYLPEDAVSDIRDAMDELFGVHPPTWTVVQQTAETILRLMHLGRVIVIGRGAHRITARLPGVLHVRLVAALEQRIEHACRAYGMTPTQARGFIQREDRGRRRYLRKYFDAEVDNPLHYHLVVNTGQFSFESAAELITRAARLAPKTGIKEL